MELGISGAPRFFGLTLSLLLIKGLFFLISKRWLKSRETVQPLSQTPAFSQHGSRFLQLCELLREKQGKKVQSEPLKRSVRERIHWTGSCVCYSRVKTLPRDSFLSSEILAEINAGALLCRGLGMSTQLFQEHRQFGGVEKPFSTWLSARPTKGTISGFISPSALPVGLLFLTF